MNVTDADLDNLRHMLGALGRDRRKWGYRNHFAPSPGDVASMERLAAIGLVIRGRPYQATHFYHATPKGCAAAGLGRTATRRALES